MSSHVETLGIIAALPQEIAGLLTRLRAAAAVRSHRRGGREYLLVEHGGRRLVVTLARIGKVAAATTATAMIHQFEVDSIVFAGVAGALSARVAVGDIVVANALRQHDMDATPLFPRFEVPLLARADFPADHALGDALAAAAVRFCAGARLPGQPHDGRPATVSLTAPENRRVHRGLILSGDRFIASESARQSLLAACPDALAVEMEGAAVAQVCHEYQVRCAVMRTISDSADADAADGFSRYLVEEASAVSSAILADFLAAGIPALAQGA